MLRGNLAVLMLALSALQIGCGSDDSGGAPHDGSAGSGGSGGSSGGSGGSAGSQPERYFPDGDWKSVTPAEAGLDGGRIDEAIAYAGQSGTQGLLIVRSGLIVAERYFGTFKASDRHESFSMAKSFSSTLVGIAIDEGLISGVDAKVCSYYPAEWDCSDASDPRSRISIEHLMTLTSGLQWNEEWSGSGGGVNDAIVMSTQQPSNPIAYVLAKPAAHEPGSHFQYSTGDPALLSGILQQATGKSAHAYALDRLLPPIGLAGIAWNTDADGRTTTFAGMQATLREFARFGYLFSSGGKWKDQTLVPADWVTTATAPGNSLVDWYGYNWHVNLPSRLEDPSLPADGFFAEGVFGQYVFVIPSTDLVIARLAVDGLGDTRWDPAHFLTLVLAALP